ncbi:MAG TPA: hypothetical protein VGK02_01105 [Candidatus Aquicultor sp.]|jgi:hypothetical protein
MDERLTIYPEPTGSFVITRDTDVMTGFSSFNEARDIAIAILSGKGEFIQDRELDDIKVGKKGVRAVLSRADDIIEERRYASKKDGSVTVETEEHPIPKSG